MSFVKRRRKGVGCDCESRKKRRPKESERRKESDEMRESFVLLFIRGQIETNLIGEKEKDYFCCCWEY